VLPDYDQLPPGLGDRRGVATVALDVTRELGAPIVGVRTWRDAIDRTAMPEAAEALDYDSLPWKHDVGTKP
jgi:hypothetical protein